MIVPRETVSISAGEILKVRVDAEIGVRVTEFHTATAADHMNKREKAVSRALDSAMKELLEENPQISPATFDVTLSFQACGLDHGDSIPEKRLS